MASVLGGIASASPAPSSAAASKLGSAGVFSKTVSLPLLGPPIVILRHSSSVASSPAKIVCLSNGSSRDGFKPLLASLSGYTFTSDSPSFPAGNASASEELAIASLGIDSRIVDALAKKGIVNLFPIQRAVFQPAMQGLDLIARAKTGTGKTLAFGIPILDNISREKNNMQFRSAGTPRAIILAPTRELAKQVENELVLAAPHLSVVCIYGGVSIEGQRRQLASTVEVVVGTPGRVIDMLERGDLRLNEVKFAILDEADQMLAVGFAEEVERIMQKLPLQRHTMLFSATMPSWIRNLTSKYLKNPTMIDLVGENVDKIAEGIKLYAVSTSDLAKNKVLADLLTVYAKGGKAIVFTKTKRDTDDVAAVMSRSIACEALHGDISQYQREKTLSGFRDGRFSVLVATDVAARGLDIPNVDLIVHYEVPGDSETFVHRSGRTGRAGKKGTCILMYTLSQKRVLRTIENEVGCKFEAIGPPAAEDVLASSSDHASESIKSVHPDLARLFLPAAQKLLEEQGVNALAAAMAHVSGVTQLPPKRSLLTYEEGYMTMQLTGGNLTDSSAVSSAVMQLSSKAGMSMGRVSMLSSSTAAGGVFDLPEDLAKDILSLQNVGSNVLTALKVLPDLQEDYFQSFSRGRSFGGGFRSGGSSYGGSSYGNRGGSSFGGSSYGNSSYGGSRTGSGYGSSYSTGGGYGRSEGSSYGGPSYNSGSSYNNRSGSYSSPSYGGSNGSSFGNSSNYGGSWSNSNSRDAGYGTGTGTSTGFGGNPGSSTGYGGTGYGGTSGSSTGYNGAGFGASSGSSTGYGGASPSTGYGGTSSSGFGGNSSTGYGGNPSGGFGESSTGFGGAQGYNANPTTPNAGTDYGWRKGVGSSGGSTGATTSPYGSSTGGYGTASQAGYGASTGNTGSGYGSSGNYGYGNSPSGAGANYGYGNSAPSNNAASGGYGSSTSKTGTGFSSGSGYGGSQSSFGSSQAPSSYGSSQAPSSYGYGGNSSQGRYGSSGYGAAPQTSPGHGRDYTAPDQNSSRGYGAGNSTPNDQETS